MTRGKWLVVVGQKKAVAIALSDDEEASASISMIVASSDFYYGRSELTEEAEDELDRLAPMATEESARLIEEAGLVPDNDPGTFKAAVRALTNQIVVAALARFVVPPGVDLATRNEHLLPDPPNDKAATPLGVRGMIERVVDGSPGGARHP